MSRPKLATPNYRFRVRGRIYVIDWTDVETGKPRSVSTGQTEREAADKWYDQWLAGREIPEPPSAPTIAEIMDGYLAERKGHVVAYERLEYAARAIRKICGDLRPDHLARRTYWDRRRRDAVSSGTIIREGITLRAALAWAVREKWITTAPYIAIPPKPPARERWLSREEAAKLLDACRSPHLRLFVLVALQTAARRGAILDLKWEQVDLAAKLIHFRVAGRQETKKRRATVPINRTLYVALEEARQVAVSDWVIEYHGARSGNPKKAFERAVKRAGIEPCTPHTLRHTAASWLVMEGVPLAQVARFLGDTEAMIERVYGKFSPSYLKDAAKALETVSLTVPLTVPRTQGEEPSETGMDSPEQTV